ncbi:MAG: hypothetical protein IPH84_03405 [Bacteroidales bacterium]|nr:hypothetical protein [Bacteroidales bacterium]
MSELQVENERSRLIFPGNIIEHYNGYVNSLQRCHSSRNPAGLIQEGITPPLGTDEGAISLLRETEVKFISLVCYSEEMHYPLLSV